MQGKTEEVDPPVDHKRSCNHIFWNTCRTWRCKDDLFQTQIADEAWNTLRFPLYISYSTKFATPRGMYLSTSDILDSCQTCPK